MGLRILLKFTMEFILDTVYLENKPGGLLSRGALAWGLIFEGGLYFSGSPVGAYFCGVYIGKSKM